MALTIPRRFNGPPGTGQGGYSAGLLAEALGAPAVEASLRRPPPLERPLAVREGDDGGLVAFDGAELVLEARAIDGVAVEPPPAVPLDVAAASEEPWGARHPFPGCFACGPARDEGDGLRLFCGPVGDGVFAGVWTPAEEHGDPVLARFLWAAMDCPTAAPFAHLEDPSVLARFAVEVRGPVRAGTPYVVATRALDVDGRKRRSAGALRDPDGTVLAVCEALWIALRPG